MLAQQQTNNGLKQKKKRHAKPMLELCWPTVYDAGPALNQQWWEVEQ